MILGGMLLLGTAMEEPGHEELHLGHGGASGEGTSLTPLQITSGHPPPSPL
jgi:hypothetical protein